MQSRMRQDQQWGSADLAVVIEKIEVEGACRVAFITNAAKPQLDLLQHGEQIERAEPGRQ